MNLKYAKQALIEFQEEHESYLEKEKSYQEYKNLPFWKKWVTKTIEPPHRDYLYRNYTVCRSPRGHLLIELRMYFSKESREITLAINEGNRGYKVNIDTGEKSYYLGKVNPNISIYAEELLENIRKELAPLYVELVLIKLSSHSCKIQASKLTLVWGTNSFIVSLRPSVQDRVINNYEVLLLSC